MKLLYRIRKYILLSIFLLFGICGDLLLWASEHYGEDLSQDIGLTSKFLKDLSLNEEFERRDSHIFVFGDHERKLQIEKIEGIDQRSADILINGEIISIEALYANALSAYPGEVSKVIVCNERFKPTYKEKNIDDIPYKYYLLHGTERFGLGACTEDTIKYKHLIGWIYCPKKSTLFIMKYFTPLDQDFNELENFVLSYSC